MTKKQAQSLVEALKQEFGFRVKCQALNKSGRYRFTVVSVRFERMSHLQRQNAIGAIVKKILPQENPLGQSMFLAFSPSDVATKV